MRTEFHKDAVTGAVTVNRVQNVEPILDRNKALATHDNGYSPSRIFRRAASIPLVVVEQWLREGIDVFNPDHASAIRAKLNSSDFLFLRTAPGHL
jgi:hypothetical protein